MSKPTILEALKSLSDIRETFRLYRIGQADESSVVPLALPVDAGILNALKAVIDIAECAPQLFIALVTSRDFASDMSLRSIGYLNRINVRDLMDDAISAGKSAGLIEASKEPAPKREIGLEPGMRPRVEACTKKRPGTFGHLEALCEGKRIICEKRGKKISLTSPDGGTTADCESLTEAYDVYRTDPAFRDLPLILGGKKEALFRLDSPLPIAGKGERHTLKEWKRIYGYERSMTTGQLIQD